MAETRQVNIEIKDNVKSLKSQFREAQAEVQTLADKYGATSEQAVNAAKRAAELKDRIGDAKSLTDAFNPDAKFKALTSSLSGVAGGFSAVTGAMGLVGAESENVQKMMLRVQSAMALSQGLQALGESRDAFKQLGVVAVQALGNIKKAIGATGIGLIVVAVGALYAYWDDIKKAVSGVGSEQRKLVVDANKNAEAAKKTYDNFKLQENSLRLQGKSEKEILKLKIDKLNTAIKTQEVEIDRLESVNKLEVAAAERNQNIVKAIIRGALEMAAVSLRLLVAPIDLVLVTANKVSKALGFGEITAFNLNNEISKLVQKGAEMGAKFLFDPAEVKAEGQKTINEAKDKLAQMKSDRDGFLLDMKKTNVEANKQVNSDNQKSAENNRKALLDQINKQYEDDRKLANEIQKQKLQLLEDGQEKELQTRQQAFDEYKENILAEYTKEEKDALDKQFENGTLSEKKYREAIAQLRKDAVSKLSKEEAESLRLAEELLQKDLLDIKEKYQKKWDDAVRTANLLKQKQDQDFQLKIEEIDEANFQAKLKKQMTEGDYEKELVRQKYFSLEEQAKNNADQLKIIEEAKRNELDAIDAKYVKKSEDRAKAEFEFKADLQTKYADIATQAAALLTATLGKSKAAQKTAVIIESAAGIAKMIISNKLANLGALATPQAIATSGAAAAPVIAANNVSLGLGIAANIAATAKALKEIGGGGTAPSAPSGGGGDSAGAGGGVMAPNFNVVGNNGINQLAQLQQQPIKAYVVGSEVTTQQALDRNRINNSTL